MDDVRPKGMSEKTGKATEQRDTVIHLLVI